MKVDENKEEQRLVEEHPRAEEKEKTVKEDDRREERGSTGRRGPPRELTNYRRTFK